LSANAGGLWTAAQDSPSQSRMNQKTVCIDTGTNLAAISPTYPGQLIFSLDSTGGFTTNFLYERNATNNAWIQISPPTSHDHSSAAQGGVFSNILVNNSGQYVQYNYFSPKLADFYTGLTTGGTPTNVQGSGNWYVNLATGTVANNTCQADIGGIAINFGSPIKFNFKVGESGGSTFIQGRMGIGIENVGALVGTGKCLGFEFCDTTGTAYVLVSGSGTARSALSTGQAFAGNNDIRFLYTPGLSVIGTVNQTVATTKTTNLPNSGACPNDKVGRFGIQTINTVGKNLLIFGGQIVGMPSDTYYL